MTRHDYLQTIDDLARFHNAAATDEAMFIYAETLLDHFVSHPEYRPPPQEASEVMLQFLPTTAFINRHRGRA